MGLVLGSKRHIDRVQIRTFETMSLSNRILLLLSTLCIPLSSFNNSSIELIENWFDRWILVKTCLFHIKMHIVFESIIEPSARLQCSSHIPQFKETIFIFIDISSTNLSRTILLWAFHWKGIIISRYIFSIECLI
jgi:hypothetical protein